MNKFFSMLEHDICYENEKQQAMKRSQNCVCWEDTNGANYIIKRGFRQSSLSFSIVMHKMISNYLRGIK